MGIRRDIRKGRVGALFTGIVVTACTLFPWTSCCAETPDLIPLLKEALSNYAGVTDYTTVFHKQQRVDGRLFDEEVINVKFKKPFKVYMKWVGSVEKGREVLFVKGENGDKMIVRPAGMLGYFAPTVSVHPKSARAMKGNLRPITESGMGNTVKLLLDVCEKARKKNELTVNYLGEGTIGERPTVRFERILPARKGYPAHRSIIELDKETRFPLLVESYGWAGELLERYRYERFKTNTGLDDGQFKRQCGDYGFGRVVVPLPSELP
jgi:outer membrane lipoprotein-sorting protein